MKSFSLPASLVEEMSAMHDKLAIKMFRAVYLYMYSDGEDTSIDRIVTIEGADFIARFKAWAQTKFDQAALRRQRAAERRRQRREAFNNDDSSTCVDLQSKTDIVPSQPLPVPGDFVAGSSDSQPPQKPNSSRSYVPTAEDEWEYGVDGMNIYNMRARVFRRTGDSRILALRYDKVALVYLLHYGTTLDPAIVKSYQEHLYKNFSVS